MVRPPVIGPHRYDAAVAAAKATPHDSLNGNLTGTLVASSGFRGSRQHPFRTAGVNHHGGVTRLGGKTPLERRHDAAPLSATAVFGRENELDAKALEEVETKEFPGVSSPVEQRG
jgi:hypothetical protein